MIKIEEAITASQFAYRNVMWLNTRTFVDIVVNSLNVTEEEANEMRLELIAQATDANEAVARTEMYPALNAFNASKELLNDVFENKNFLKEGMLDAVIKDVLGMLSTVTEKGIEADRALARENNLKEGK